MLLTFNTKHEPILNTQQPQQYKKKKKIPPNCTFTETTNKSNISLK